MSLLIGCPVILPPRDDVVASWTHRPHLLVVNGERDIWQALADREHIWTKYQNLEHMRGQNLGVAASWNLIFWYARERGYSHVALVSQGVVLKGGTTRLAELVDEYADWRGLLTDFAWHCIVLSVKLWEQIGDFDEDFSPAYYEDCLTPDTPVLTADLRWVPVGDLVVGSELVGVDEDSRESKHRRYRRSVVTRTGRRVQPCYRLTMEDGREVRASAGHGWLTVSPTSRNARWRTTDRLVPGQRIYAPLRYWPNDETFEAGWLAGIIDGEASMHASEHSYDIVIAQLEGPVLDRIKQILAAMDIEYTWRLRPPARPDLRPIANVEISQKRFVMETLGRLRPSRFDTRSWIGRAVQARPQPVLRLESIEQIGPAETVTLSTSTHTFIANGMISHNSDYVRRMFLAGVHTPVDRMPKVERDQLTGTEATAAAIHLIHPDTYGLNAALYERKWGGPPFKERFLEPYNALSVDGERNWSHADGGHLGRPETKGG